MVRHAQITQNNKFAISLQYPKKEVSNDVDFLHADKHESLLQIDIMIDGDDEAFPKFPKYQVCNVLIVSQKKEDRDEVDFLQKMNFIPNFFFEIL